MTLKQHVSLRSHKASSPNAGHDRDPKKLACMCVHASRHPCIKHYETLACGKIAFAKHRHRVSPELPVHMSMCEGYWNCPQSISMYVRRLVCCSNRHGVQTPHLDSSKPLTHNNCSKQKRGERTFPHKVPVSCGRAQAASALLTFCGLYLVYETATTWSSQCSSKKGRTHVLWTARPFA